MENEKEMRVWKVFVFQIERNTKEKFVTTLNVAKLVCLSLKKTITRIFVWKQVNERGRFRVFLCQKLLNDGLAFGWQLFFAEIL